jgi:putative DNA methylase
LVCREPADDSHIKKAGIEHQIGSQLLAMVVDAKGGRLYIDPDPEHIRVAELAKPDWVPDQELSNDPRNIWCIPYGLTRIKDLFTPRQLTVLSAMSAVIEEAKQQALKDGADEVYANALTTYLSLAFSRMTDFANAICSWDSGNTNLRQLFSRQAIPMSWDYVESNLIDGIVNLESAIEWAISALRHFSGKFSGEAHQLDAAAALETISQPVISTDPPYYDNIAYADLSDFFYVWLRRCLGKIYPSLFATLLVPKAQELVATPYRFGGSKEKARQFFEEHFRSAFSKMRQAQNPEYPLTVYYAFKQSETEEGKGAAAQSVVSTGWETMLEGLLDSEFQITGTWPIRTEQQQRSIAYETNALASSIVLVCRLRPENAGVTTRKDFLAILKKELPHALRNLQKGNIAPVDLAQAAIGPGMAVFSRYKKVLETDGSPMRVRTALALINQGLDEVLSELESEFDPDTRWALAWFEQHQFDEGAYGEAEVLATAKALSISHLAEAGILHSRAGKVRLLRREELPEDWDPSAIGRLTVWEVTQHLIRRLDQKGETETANLKAKIGGMAEIARDLAYRLYTLCERKGWADEAGYYNSLVVAWPSMASEAFELS